MRPVFALGLALLLTAEPAVAAGPDPASRLARESSPAFAGGTPPVSMDPIAPAEQAPPIPTDGGTPGVQVPALSTGSGTSARSAPSSDFHWESPAWEVRTSGLPSAAMAERPEWGDRQIVLEGKILWVVAILPPSVKTWSERVDLGTRQAEATLQAFAEYLVEARSAEDPQDYRDRQISSVRFRLASGLDRQGFVKVETAERPRAVWMRFGYPAEKLEAALGFRLPGAVAMQIPPKGHAPRQRLQQARQVGERPPDVWDYIWELGWLGGVAAVTVAAVLFAAATQP